MRRAALVISGIGAIVAGVTPIAQAQSGMPSNSNNSAVTLSGESLRTVENRSVSDDSRYFFPGNSGNSQNGNQAQPTGIDESQPSLQLNNNLQIVVGDTLDSGDPLDLFPNTGDAGDSQRVKLQLPLNAE
ncbi:MAG TPA: hypothetical protein DDW51_27050 [Cyanobacteria bacterium UBA11367]|nr:hypothetical protein [Cyanobacteria bacterium UBA11367]